MKHLKLFFMATACLLASVSCESERVISVDELPAAAMTYIQQNHPTANVIYVKKEAELLSTTYEVALDNGMKIEFDGDGAPVDVDMKD